MTEARSIRFLRPQHVMERVGLRHSKLYSNIAEQLFPPFIKFGRASALPEHEVDAMMIAITAGATDEQLRKLVQKLVAQRHTAFAALGTEDPATASAP